MWDNLKNEEAYHHYFQQLLELEDGVKNGKIKDFTDFRILPFSETSKNLGHSKSKSSKSSKNTKTTSSSKNVKSHPSREVPLNINFVVSLIERTKQRREILDDFLINCGDELAYESYFKKLVSLEERLIED